jgi:hypothetical protein
LILNDASHRRVALSCLYSQVVGFADFLNNCRFAGDSLRTFLTSAPCSQFHKNEISYEKIVHCARSQTTHRAGCVAKVFPYSCNTLILLNIFRLKNWHAGCNSLLSPGRNELPQPNKSEEPRMTRQRAAQVRISPLHIQQGLFGVLALLITLIACQQYLRWENSQQAEPLISIQHKTQTHFSAVSSSQAESASMRMMDVDQAQPLDQLPREERWVF